jgi:UDP-N-acetylmuramyl pentapeptide phosphotransferase/UDP-N-acetylglucosamine-1-phosphate transferase
MFNIDYQSLIKLNFKVFLVLIGVFSFFINYFLSKQIRYIGIKRHLFVKTKDRDSHKTPTVAFGGLSIFIVSIFTLLLIIGSGINNSAGFFMSACFLLLMAGIKDDLVGSGAASKLIIQLIASLLFICNPNFVLGNMGGFLGFHVIDPNYMTYCLGLSFILLTSNAFNFIDGVDGLCATIAIICCVVFSLYFYEVQEYFFCTFCIILIGSLGSFLIFNLNSGIKKMFLGDAGSVLIGFLIAIFSVRIIELQPIKPFNDYHPVNSILYTLVVLAFPLSDALQVIILRISKGLSPWKADRRHLHHDLLSKNFKHIEIVLIVSLLQIFTIIGFLLLKDLGQFVLHLYTIFVYLNFIVIIKSIKSFR